MAECGKLVGKGVVSYPCAIERGHTGPCMSPDNAASVRAREAWDKAVLREQQAHPAVVVDPQGHQTTHDFRQGVTDRVAGVGGDLPDDLVRSGLRELREGYAPSPTPVTTPQASTLPPWGVGLKALDREKAADRGGQPVPIHQEGEPSMHDLLMAEVEKRKSLGLSRYGTILQANNGRDALQDLLDELIDGCVYLMQLIRERDLRRAAEEQPEGYAE